MPVIHQEDFNILPKMTKNVNNLQGFATSKVNYCLHEFNAKLNRMNILNIMEAFHFSQKYIPITFWENIIY